MKILAYLAAFAFAAIGYCLGWIGKDTLVAPSFFLALACGLLANLDRFQSIKAAGVEATIREAKVAARESRELALLTSQMLLSLMKRAGRIGQYKDAQQRELQQAVDRVLDQFDASDSERRQVYSDWYLFERIDYVFGILGGNTVPKFASENPPEGIATWKSLRRRTGEGNPPSPDDLEAFPRTIRVHGRREIGLD